MKKPIHVAMSPLTGQIFAGTVLRGGLYWESGPRDVTIEALVAVAEHVVRFGQPVEISKESGELEYRITVEKFDGDAA